MKINLIQDDIIKLKRKSNFNINMKLFILSSEISEYVTVMVLNK